MTIEGGKEASLVERLEDNNWREDEAVSDTLNRWGDERREAAARIRALEAQASTYREALEAIRDLEPIPFEGGLDWSAIDACSDCQAYKDHPVQRGICNTHRRPQWDREKHDQRELERLGYRAKAAARRALSSSHGGGNG